MKKIFRLSLQRDFNSVFKRGLGSGSTSLTIKYLENGKKIFRLAVIVSKKVAKKAVARNLLRRRLKEIFRKHSPQLIGWDVILIAKPELAKKSFLELAETLEKTLKRTKIFQ
ncbi:MAG TPA: ribonuclease P protein component [Candidatus Paceibacterota bacterium]|nr:ribonuclease P protein component [Candidatus Paceibacterota bacterium]